MKNKTILISGGTGSFGQSLTQLLINSYSPKKIIIFSRDEYKQHLMAKKFPQKNIRFFIGDVRDKRRLYRAFEGVDYVVHAAALKQIPAMEYNPTEAVRTNIDGANNVIDAAIDRGVKKVVALSTDKAVNPINLYGATKLVAEKLFLAANAYGGRRVQFSIVRYGNVINSRGSIVELFLKLKKEGIREFPITSPSMTRFWISLPQAANLVIKMLSKARGGEIWVPLLPALSVLELAKMIYSDCKPKYIGIRKGEKIHETLISEYEGEEYSSNKPVRELTSKELWEAIKNENYCNYSGKIDFVKISS